MRAIDLVFAASLLMGALAPRVPAADIKLPHDGWVSWELPAVEGAPFWCCWANWNKDPVNRAECDLDGGMQNFGHRDHETTDAIRVYARSRDGKLDRLQAFAASCPVKAGTPIQPLDVASDDSVRWLAARAKGDEADSGARRSLVEHVLAALAAHRGDLARNELGSFARNDSRAEVRKLAVFWLSMVRGVEGAEIISTVMFNDDDAEVRKHAAFAMSQSRSPRKAQELIRQGNADKVGDVRAQAWFWLAQTGAPEAEQAVTEALRKDADDHVREQAVFALSQLPGERATKALIKAAEDQSLSREQRKRAVFWLSQSESDAAQAYLEKVLTRTAAK